MTTPQTAEGPHARRPFRLPVCFLGSRFKPEAYGGVEEAMWQVTSEMARQGYQIEVLTENHVGAPATEILAPGVHVRRLEPFHPGLKWRWYHLAQVEWWFRALRAHKPRGVVWASDPTMAVAAVLAGYRRRLVYNPASCAAGVATIGRQYRHAKSLHVPKSLVRLDSLACRWTRTMVVSSKNLKEQFERFYGPRSNLFVTPYAVKPATGQPAATEARRSFGLPSDGFVVGFVGRLDPCKGIDFLFDAIRECGLGEDDRLLIVGDGPDRARLQALAATAGIERNIVWTGHVTDASRVYAAMDVLVLPSFYEAFGLVLIEAMSAGIPVIGRTSDDDSTLTASSEIITDGSTGFVTRGSDPGELGSRLGWLRANPTARRSMGRAAQVHVNARTWSTVVGDYRNVLETLS